MPCFVKIVRNTLFCSLFATTASIAHAQASVVAGVSQVVSGGAAGSIYPETADWSGLVGGDDDASFPSLFAASRSFGAGRVIAVGHEAILTNSGSLDNGTFLVNALEWLAAGTGGNQVRFSNGHGEFATSSAGLAALASAQGLTVQNLGGTLSAASLSNVAVLVVGNAWGTFSAAEIQAVEQWVNGGGGLLLGGLGWSWLAFNSGATLENYPMAQFAEPYGVRWLSNTISDPTNNLSGSTIFSTFYPSVPNLSVGGSLSTIALAHTTHGAALASQLQSDATLRRNFVRSHSVLGLVATDFAPSDPQRVEVYDGLRDLMTQQSAFYGRGFSFNEAAQPTAAWIRERMWRSWRDALPLDAARKLEMSTLGNLTGIRADVFDDFGMILMDNDRLDLAQLTVIRDMRTLIPTGLDTLHGISVRDYLGTPPETISVSGDEYSINIFGVDVAQATENPFPSDVPSYAGDLFSSVLAHEYAHVVDAVDIGEANGAFDARRDQLIADAGDDAQNYLRSVVSDGFFTNAPQEFFASIANQYMNNSRRTLDLGLIRFDNGRPDPINQFLFFCDVFSAGGATSYLYLTNTLGVITRTEIGLGRDAQGRIERLVLPDQQIDFTLSTSGDVTGYTITIGTPFVRGDCNGDATIDIGDAIRFLAWIFQDIGPVPVPECRSACDVNDSGTLEILDAVDLLSILFGTAPTMSQPFPQCGADPTSDLIACANYDACP